ncbi:MAG: iron-sulfur cluster carrier protein ApbC [Pseudomonadota bacterium]
MQASQTCQQLREQILSMSMPLLDTPVAGLGVVKVSETPDGIFVVLSFGFPCDALELELLQAVRDLPAALELESTLDVKLEWKVKARAVSSGLTPLPGVANIIAVASGKGGVGKSTTAVNLALALAAAGARCGILDADIYGPSQPRMLGIKDAHPQSDDGKTMDPLRAHGVEAMSVGFLVDEQEPMVWRGPMVTSALNQILTQTRWGDLDYLIVDMPPGTGDIQLTLSQRVPVAGALIVTTPQDIALLDARKGLKMFEKVGVPVLGVVENMSLHVCSNCGHEEAIFGTGGADRLAQESGVNVLGQLPLDMQIRKQADGGEPTVVAEPEGAIARAYTRVALAMVAELAGQREEHKHKFPKIVVENS